MKNYYQTEKAAAGRGEETGDYKGSEITPGVLRFLIPYTTPELTRVALRHAGVCTDLDIRVLLVDVQVVPYPCSIDRPPLNKEHSESRLRQLLAESGLPGDSMVLYARDWHDGFRRALEPGTLAIIATQKRWWQTREAKLARALSSSGHDIMLLPVAR